MLKKALALFLAVTMTIGLASCGKSRPQTAAIRTDAGLPEDEKDRTADLSRADNELIAELLGDGYRGRGLWLISCFVGKGRADDLNGGDLRIFGIFRDLLKMGRERYVTFHGNCVLHLIGGKSGAGRNGSITADPVDGGIGCPVGKLISRIWK